jgi:hypothetical protein
MMNLSVGMHDLEFDRKFVFAATDSDPTPRFRWVPVGMPKIRGNFPRTVFYLFGHPDNQFVPHDRPIGTGFFVGVRSNVRHLTWHVYAVSNRHVVEVAPFIRINTKVGPTRVIQLQYDDWNLSATNDLAAADVTDLLAFDHDTLLWADEISWIDEVSFLGERPIPVHQVGIGDDTFMVGLFDDHRTSPRNTPVGRFGNVAAIPDILAPLGTGPADKNAFQNPCTTRNR